MSPHNDHGFKIKKKIVSDLTHFVSAYDHRVVLEKAFGFLDNNSTNRLQAAMVDYVAKAVAT